MTRLCRSLRSQSYCASWAYLSSRYRRTIFHNCSNTSIERRVARLAHRNWTRMALSTFSWRSRTFFLRMSVKMMRGDASSSCWNSLQRIVRWVMFPCRYLPIRRRPLTQPSTWTKGRERRYACSRGFWWVSRTTCSLKDTSLTRSSSRYHPTRFLHPCRWTRTRELPSRCLMRYFSRLSVCTSSSQWWSSSKSWKFVPSSNMDELFTKMTI